MFYDNLNTACKKKGTTVTALLKQIGLGTANGTFWKNGSSPSGDVLIQLSKYLNVTIDYLLTGKEKNTSPELPEDVQRLINMYNLLTDMEKGEMLGDLKHQTQGRIEAKNKEDALVSFNKKRVKTIKELIYEEDEEHPLIAAETGGIIDPNNDDDIRHLLD